MSNQNNAIEYYPRSMLVECNRTNSISKDDDNSSWTSTIQQVQLREGDQIQLHSAYIHSIGNGDLITYNHTGELQDDEVRVLYSFYVNNTALNQMREGYNFNTSQGKGYSDIDNKPMPLYRWQHQTTDDPSPDYGIGNTHSPIEDKYVPGLFHNRVTVKPMTQVLKDVRFTYNNSQTGYGATTLAMNGLISRHLHWGRSYHIFFSNMNPPQPNTSYHGVWNVIGGSHYGAPTNKYEYVIIYGNELNVFGSPPGVDSVITCDIEFYQVPTIMSGNSSTYGEIVAFIPFDESCQYQVGSKLYNRALWVGEYINKEEFEPNAGSIEPAKYSNILSELTVLGRTNFENPLFYRETTLFSPMTDVANQITIPYPLDGFNYEPNLLIWIDNEDDTFEVVLTGPMTGSPAASNATFPIHRPIAGDNPEVFFGSSDPKAHAAGVKIKIYNLYQIIRNIRYTCSIDSGDIYDSLLESGWGNGSVPEGDKDAYRYESIITDKTFDELPEILYGNSNNLVNFQIPNTLQVGVLGNSANWVKHYRYKDFNLKDINYASPSDISTMLTDQAHELTNLRATDGTEIEDTKGIGLPQNEFIFPVWSASHYIDPSDQVRRQLSEPTSNQIEWHLPDGTEVKGAHAEMANLPEGTFCCIHDVEGIPEVKKGTQIKIPAVPNGKYFVYFRTYPFYHNVGDMYPDTGRGQFSVIYEDGYDIPKTSTPSISTVENAQTFAGYPVEYGNIPGKDVLVSQLCGSPNVTFDYDEAGSRFTMTFLHAPHVSTYSITNGVEQGGDPSVVVYYPSPGPYLKNRTRIGGVNIEGWAIDKISHGQYQPGDTYNHPLDSTYFNPIGLRFWNKLGYSKSFMLNHVGWSDTEPLGTTDGKIDSADALVVQVEPPESAPRYWDVGFFDPKQTSTLVQAKYEYSSFGGMYLNNIARGYGLPTSTAYPNQYEESKYTKDEQFGDNNSYFTTSSENRSASTFNPDRQRHRASTIKAVSTKLQADGEPIKNSIPYFFITTDLLDESEGYTSTNFLRLPICGVVSKLDNNLDYFYGHEGIQTFIVRKDRIVTQINVHLLNSNMERPQFLGPNSSVIFQITRNSENPTPIVPNILQQQMISYKLLTDIVNQNKKKKQSEQTIIEELYDDVFNELETQLPVSIGEIESGSDDDTDQE